MARTDTRIDEGRVIDESAPEEPAVKPSGRFDREYGIDVQELPAPAVEPDPEPVPVPDPDPGEPDGTDAVDGTEEGTEDGDPISLDMWCWPEGQVITTYQKIPQQR